MFCKNILWKGILLAFISTAWAVTPVFAETSCEESSFTSTLAKTSIKIDRDAILLVGSEQSIIDSIDAELADDFFNKSVQSFVQQFIQSPNKDKLEKLILLASSANNCPLRLDGTTLQPSEREEYALFLTFVFSLNEKWLSDSGLLNKSFREAKNSPLAKAALARIYLFGLVGYEKNITAFGNFVAQGSGTSLGKKTLLWAFKNDVTWSAKELFVDIISSSCEFNKSFGANPKKHMSELCEIINQTKQ